MCVALQAVMISSSVFAGMLAGGLFFGLAADRIGRRKSYIITMIMNSICAASFSFSENAWVMAALRFFTGVGVGGAVPAVFTLGLEVAPNSFSIVFTFPNLDPTFKKTRIFPELRPLVLDGNAKEICFFISESAFRLGLSLSR